MTAAQDLIKPSYLSMIFVDLLIVPQKAYAQLIASGVLGCLLVPFYYDHSKRALASAGVFA